MPAAQPLDNAPFAEQWSPGEWGSGDMAGAVNRTTPASVLAAVGLVRQGKIATLGKVYQRDTPVFGDRGWRMTIPGLPTGGPFGTNHPVYSDEYLAAEIGQIGTRFDGPGDIGTSTPQGMFFCNDRMLDRDPVIGACGLGPLGVERVAEMGFVCRGVLLDAVAYRGGRLPVPPVRSLRGGAGWPGAETARSTRPAVLPQRCGASCAWPQLGLRTDKDDGLPKTGAPAAPGLLRSPRPVPLAPGSDPNGDMRVMEETTKTALASGANRGIGEAVAKALAVEGVHVLMGCRDLERGRAAAAPMAAEGLEVMPVQLDVTDAQSVEALANEIGAKFGRLDILVDNAGGSGWTTCPGSRRSRRWSRHWRSMSPAGCA